MKSSLPVFISLPSLKSPLFYALPYPAKQRHFNFRHIAFKTALFTPIFAIILTACLSNHQPKNLFAVPQTITSPGLTVTIDNDDPFTFSLDAGVTHSKTQTLTLNTTSAGGYTINMETGGFIFAPAGQTQTILTSDLVNTSDPNDTTKRIPSLTTDTPYNNIQNAYGYNFTNGNLTVTNATIFKPAPQIINDNGTMKSETIKLAETDHKNLTDDTYSLAVAVQADTSISAGTYQNVLNILITANIADYTVYFCDNKDDQNPCDNPTSQLISEGIPEQLDPNPYTRPGYAFKGWNTLANGTGTTYPANYKTSPGHEIEDENGVQATSGGSVNLYAMWQAEEYTVIYDGNTATSGTMNNQTILRDTPTNLTKNQYTKTGYYFAGWADAPDGNVLYTDEQQVENLAPINGTITLYAKWTTSQYNVVYDGNHATSGTTASQTVGYNEQLPLNANGFNRTGSRFLGWATTSWANTPKYTNSQTLTPAQVNELVAGLNHGDTVTLYAVWETPLAMAYADAGKTKVTVGSDSYYTMQDMDPSICYATNVIGDASITPVVDTRDNKIYLVTKLADDRCWMVQNLDHDIDKNRTYTPADTDIPANWKPDKSTYATGDRTWDSTEQAINIQQSHDPGNKIWDGSLNNLTTVNIDNMPQGTNIHYSIGNYYNFGATVAMNDTSAYTTDGQDLNQSICPAHWTLPKDGNGSNNADSGTFRYLLSKYNVSTGSTMKLWDAPLYFVPTGRYYGTSGLIGNIGAYGSPVVHSSTHYYTLRINSNGNVYEPSSTVPPFDNVSPRNFGWVIRCIAKNNYTVKFNSNGGSGNMPDQSMEYGAYTNLANYSFTPPANKTFIGWNTNANGTGTSYQNTASVVNLAGTNTSITLYAQYGVTLAQSYASAGKTQQNGYYKLQDMTPGICAATTLIGETSRMQAIDIRDNKIYNITKLDDNKCWMIQNLALGDMNQSKTLTPADSDVSANFTIPASAIQNSGNDIWNTPVDSIHIYNNGNSWIEVTSVGNDSIVHTTGTPPNNSYYIGNYYNWYTATAGTGTTAMTSGNATNSICPKGWRLPTGGASSDITGLTDTLVGITANTTSVPIQSFAMQSTPNYFILSGRYHTEDYRGGYGLWWSSTAQSSYRSHDLYLTASNVNPQNHSNKNNGFAVRCIAR